MNAYLWPLSDAVSGYYYSGTCIPCPLQTYRDYTTVLSQQYATACLTAPPGTVVTVSATNYTICGIGTNPVLTTTNSKSCEVCQPNSYAPYPAAGCYACPSVAGIQCYNGQLFTQFGYYAFISSSLSPNIDTLLCSTPSDCPGVQLIDSTAWYNLTYHLVLSNQCSWPEIDSPDVPMCAACAQNYLRWKNQCIPCKGNNGGLFLAMFVITFLIVVFLFLTSHRSSTLTGMLIFYIQVAAIQIGNQGNELHISSTDAAIGMYSQLWLILCSCDAGTSLRHMNEVNISGSVFLSECWISANQYNQVLISLAVPWWMTMQLCLLGIIHKYILMRFWPHSFATSFSLDTYKSTFLSILLFSYTPIALTCLTYLNCTHIGQWFVVYNLPDIQCGTTQYNAYLSAVVIVLIGYVVGLPLSIFIYLYRHRSVTLDPITASYSASFLQVSLEMNDHSSSLSLADSSSYASLRASDNRIATQQSTDSMALATALRVLLSIYTESSWYWSVVMLVQRFLFVLTSIVLAQHQLARYIVYCLLNISMYYAHIACSPYPSALLNWTQGILYHLLLLLSILLGFYATSVDAWLESILFLLVLMPSSILLLWILRDKYVQWKQQSIGMKEMKHNTVTESKQV